MRITRRQIRRLIKEAWQDETGSDLLAFAKAYASLGNAVREQVDAIVNAYYSHGVGSDMFEEVVYQQNPNAIDSAIDRLGRPIRQLGTDEAEDIGNCLDHAQAIYLRSDEEILEREVERERNIPPDPTGEAGEGFYDEWEEGQTLRRAAEHQHSTD